MGRLWSRFSATVRFSSLYSDIGWFCTKFEGQEALKSPWAGNSDWIWRNKLSSSSSFRDYQHSPRFDVPRFHCNFHLLKTTRLYPRNCNKNTKNNLPIIHARHLIFQEFVPVVSIFKIHKRFPGSKNPPANTSSSQSNSWSVQINLSHGAASFFISIRRCKRVRATCASLNPVIQKKKGATRPRKQRGEEREVKGKGVGKGWPRGFTSQWPVLYYDA